LFVKEKLCTNLSICRHYAFEPHPARGITMYGQITMGDAE